MNHPRYHRNRSYSMMIAAWMALLFVGALAFYGPQKLDRMVGFKHPSPLAAHVSATTQPTTLPAS
jgi:hypothetical protein